MEPGKGTTCPLVGGERGAAQGDGRIPGAGGARGGAGGAERSQRGAREEPAGSVEASRLEPARTFLQALGCGREQHSGGATAELDSQPRPPAPAGAPRRPKDGLWLRPPRRPPALAGLSADRMRSPSQAAVRLLLVLFWRPRSCPERWTRAPAFGKYLSSPVGWGAEPCSEERPSQPPSPGFGAAPSRGDSSAMSGSGVRKRGPRLPPSERDPHGPPGPHLSPSWPSPPTGSAPERWPSSGDQVAQ